jgi:16S rRNA (cytosine967-C5)-methyltransferase
MPSKARTCAYTVLRRVFERGAYADLALRAEARELDARDRALAMRLSYGAVQRRGTLDYLIERLAERPLKRLDASVLAALRLGLYELLYLGGAPDHAVVADAVELAKVGGTKAAHHGGRAEGRGHGLVNAVLRRATRDGAALLDELDDRTPEGAALKHSHPEWIARLWWDQLGAEDARALLAFDNQPAELALRVNTLVAEPASVAAQLRQAPRPVAVHTDPAIPEALVLDGPWDAYGSPQWRAGAVLTQSRGAMLPARALAPERGERVLDLCAAPGGKTTHLAALMGGSGEVVAVERNPRRAADLQRTVVRLHAQECVRVVLGDAARPLEKVAQPQKQASPPGAGWPPKGVAESRGAAWPLQGVAQSFDRVLVDPPCSGLGTLQARADLRWRVTPEDLAALARRQAAILAAGAAAVRPGGVLVYSTCTISATENERQISAFLESNPDFALDDLGAELCDGQRICRGRETPASSGQHPRLFGRRLGGCVLTLPHRDRTAGFFIARLRRR